MPTLYRLALIAAGLTMSAACSNLAALPTPPLESPPPARCLVLCPEMPATDPDPLQAVTDLQDWGSDCRVRQRECRDWAAARKGNGP